MPSLLNFNAFCEELPEVNTSKVFEKKFFHPAGLFSEQLFGPLKNYQCQCGTYYGETGGGGTCATCEVDIVNSTERRRRFAKIILPHSVVNPLFYDLLIDLSGQKSDFRGAIDQLMKDENALMYRDEDNDEYVVTTNTELTERRTTFSGVEAINILVKNISDKLVESGEEDWEIIQTNIDQLIINYIIVLPPDLRPASKNMTKGNPVNVDEINKYYTFILTKKEIMEQTQIEINRNNSMKFDYYRQLQNAVNELYHFILGKLSKKEGLIRGNILGKRIDFSARAVIVPDPTLKIYECALPYLMFMELFKHKISKELVNLNKFKCIHNAIEYIERCIDTENSSLFNLCEILSKDELCILNRQPSLHRLSVLGFKLKITLDSIIKIHPLVCPPFNADFDGDQMAVYIPISVESKQEVMDKLLVTNNLINPSNGTLSTKPSQDMVLGIYALTNNEFKSLRNKVLYKGKEITESRKIFNKCLPKGYPLIDEVVSSKLLVSMLTSIQKNYETNVIAEVLDNIKMVGFKYATLFGATMSLDDCYIEGYKKIRDEIYGRESLVDQIRGISSDEVLDFLKKGFKYSYMIDSGSRGTYEQAGQMLFTRGFISNFDGKIISDPIKSNYLEGMNPKELFNSTYGSRKGLLDVALNTGMSGYLSRKLVFTCVNLMLDKNIKDCGTTDLLPVFVNNNKKAEMLFGKWMKTDSGLEMINESNCYDLIGQTIQIRSVMYCLSEKVCTICYGYLYKLMDSRFVGIIAAQSIGECNTQLVLRTFHISGLAKLAEEDENDNDGMKQQDIVNDLSRASKLLHSASKNFDTLVSELFDIYNTGRPIYHVHFECVVSQLMWSGTRKWRLKENRQQHNPIFHSVQVVPSFESWLMGLAFSNPRKHIIKGILDKGRYKGIFDKMLCGEKI